MGIKSELHEAILKRGGKVPPYGGIAAAMDELNKLPGGGGDCDWNIMKNKPFYSETVQGAVLQNEVISLSEGTGIINTSFTLVSGEKYSVKWSGSAVYECVAADYVERDAVIGAAVGNLGALTGGNDTGEPFIIVSLNPEAAVAMGAKGMAVDLTGELSNVVPVITGSVESVKQIEAKYIPGYENNVRRCVVKVKYNETSGAYGTDSGYSEVLAALRNGDYVCCEVVTDGGTGVLHASNFSEEGITFMCVDYDVGNERLLGTRVTFDADHSVDVSFFEFT